MLYSWLPSQMFEFKLAEIRTRFEQKHNIGPSLRDCFVHSPFTSPQAPTARWLFLRLRRMSNCECRPQRPLWNLIQAQERSSDISATVRTRVLTNLGIELRPATSSTMIAGAKIFRAESLTLGSAITTVTWLFSNEILAARVRTSATIARIEMDLIDTMIDAAHKLNEAIFPS